MLSVKASNETHVTTFSWDTGDNTDYYNLFIWHSSTNENVLSAYNIRNTVYSCSLPAGNYFAIVTSVHGSIGDSDFAFTDSDQVNFTIFESSIAYTPIATAVVGDRIFAAFESRVSWYAANLLAEKMDGKLASIHNQTEQDAVASLIEQSTVSCFWLGGSDHESEGIWKWEDNTPWDYQNWDSIEPNNSSGWWGDEDYLVMYQNSKEWNDACPDFADDLNTYYGFIVAYDVKQISSTKVAVAEYGASEYWLFAKGMGVPWEVAQAYCETLGGHLATVTSAEEQEVITSLAKQGERHCFLGATDKENEGIWRWVTGESFSYTNWRQSDGQPDNYGQCENYLEWCYSEGLWNDSFSCPYYVGFICEFDRAETPAPASPTIGLIGATRFTVVAQEGYQYSLDGENWQDSNTFTNLLPGFEYCVYQRKASTHLTFASPASNGITVLLNGNDPFTGNFTAYHLVWVKQKLLTQDNNMAVDINGDGVTNILDLVRLKKTLAA